MSEVEQNIVICQVTGQRLRQIIDLRDTGKSRYFAITEFKNCFIIRLPSLFFNEYLREGVRAHCLSCMSNDRDQIASFPFCSFKRPNTAAHEQTIICGQLFAGHVVNSRPMKRKKNLHPIIR